jgi:DNA-binding transcriptional LysR family regulator
MNDIDLRRLDLNLLVVFEVLMTEGSVTRAAARLSLTQSAVSHALARLRAQVGDPLLVKVGGRMRPSPFAEQLAEDVRPILRSIQRVLVPPQAFEPATSARTFRIAIPDFATSLFPLLAARVRRAAPSVALEWVVPGPEVLLAVADGQIDVALGPAAAASPEGLEREEVGTLKWATFARRGHPAIVEWGPKAWARWPHVAVRTGSRVPSPVAAAAGALAGERRVLVWVPNFAAVAPLLARTDLLATLPRVVMHESMNRFGLRALRPPVAVPPMPHQLVWSQRLAGDPAIRWIRGQLGQVFAEVLAAADARPVRSPRTRR